MPENISSQVLHVSKRAKKRNQVIYLATGNASANEKEAFGLQLSATAVSISVVRVSSINHNVARLQVWDQLVDGLVDRIAGTHLFSQGQI